MLTNGRFCAGIDVEGLQGSIQTAAPDVDRILEGAGQHGVAVTVLQPQIVALKLKFKKVKLKS